MLKRSPHCRRNTLDPVLAFVFKKAIGWMKNLFVVFLMTGSDLRSYSNCLTIPGKNLLMSLVLLALVLVGGRN
jgi:hypothetical protein